MCSLYLAFTTPEDVSQELFVSNEDELKEGTSNFSLSALKVSEYSHSNTNLYIAMLFRSSRKKFLILAPFCKGDVACINCVEALLVVQESTSFLINL